MLRSLRVTLVYIRISPGFLSLQVMNDGINKSYNFEPC